MHLPKFLTALRPRRTKMVLFTGLAVVSLLVTALLVIQVFFKLDDLRGTGKDNIQYTLAQIEVDHARLQSAVEALDRRGAAGLPVMRNLFDSLYNRVDIVINGQGYRSALAGTEAAAHAAALWADLPNVAKQVDAPDAAILADPEPLRDSVETLGANSRLLAMSGVSIYAQRADNELGTLNALLIRLTVVSIVMLAGFISLVVLLWQLYQNYRRRALQNRTTLRRLSTILETSQDAILVVRRDGTLVDVNGAAASVFGLDASQRIHSIDTLLWSESPGAPDHPITGADLFASCAKGPNTCEALTGQSLDGRRFPIELSNSLTSQSGNEVCVCFVRDISERRRAEAEIATSRDRAVAGERAKARFLGMISHEMRTPLNGILGTLDILGETKLGKDQKTYLRIMQSSGQVLLSQINDALELTRTDPNEIEIEAHAFDLDALLLDLIESQAPGARANGSSLEWPAPEVPLGAVTGDRGRLRQVLLNLLSNAVKYTRDGQINLTARRLTAPDAAQVEFVVSDTGVGIPDDMQARIFDDFVRVTDTTPLTVEGTGLGLGIARQLVDLMGGTIGVDSHEGRGSRFWVRLPLPVALSAPGQSPPQTQTKTDPKRVLVVEDNDTNRFVLTEMLRRDGHHVTEAENGRIGADIARDQGFDLILMDISMPVMNGMDATRAIRATPGPSQGAHIVALTAHFKRDLDTQYQAAGLDAVESKPIRLPVLRALVSGLPPADPGTSDAKDLPNIDLDVLDQLRALITPDKMQDLIAGFLAEGDHFFANLSALHAQPKPEQMHRIHQFAGSAATFGARTLRNRLIAAETAINKGAETPAFEQLARLARDWPELRQTMQQSLLAQAS